MRHKVNFLAELNRFEFSFLSRRSVAIPIIKSSLSYYLPIAEWKIIEFIPFPRVLMLCEMQLASSWIWTRVAVSISYDGKYLTKHVFSWLLCKKSNLGHNVVSFITLIEILYIITSTEISCRFLGSFYTKTILAYCKATILTNDTFQMPPRTAYQHSNMYLRNIEPFSPEYLCKFYQCLNKGTLVFTLRFKISNKYLVELTPGLLATTKECQWHYYHHYHHVVFWIEFLILKKLRMSLEDLEGKMAIISAI